MDLTVAKDWTTSTTCAKCRHSVIVIRVADEAGMLSIDLGAARLFEDASGVSLHCEDCIDDGALYLSKEASEVFFYNAIEVIARPESNMH